MDDVIMPPVHPGEILLAEFLEPLELSQYQLARSIAVPARRINEIVHGQPLADVDWRLSVRRQIPVERKRLSAPYRGQ